MTLFRIGLVCLAALATGCASTRTYVDREVAADLAKPIKVALLIQGDVEGAELMNERLFNRLHAFADFQPVERKKLTSVALANRLAETGLTAELAKEIGAELGVQAVFVGNFMLYKTSHIHTDVWDGAISIRLVRTNDFRTVWTADYSTDYAFAPFSSMVGVGTVVNYCTDAVVKSLRSHWQ